MRQTGTDKIAAFAFQAGVADLLEGIPHGAAIVDQEFRMVAMNGLLEAMTGHDSADARGVDADSIIRSNLGAAGRNWRKLIAGDATSSVEGDVLTAQRKRLPARLTLKPIKDGFGVAAGVFVLVEDISLIKEIESKGLSGQVSHGFIGTSPKMLEIFETLPVLASTNATLLVTGETGTGKDLLAESVHKASRRSNYPFIKVNCGALPESLLESELFGHVKGAFTGAHADKPGMFRLAQGGTIYLTEIGDLPLPLQVKLLLLAIIVITIFGPGLFNAMLAIGIAQVPLYARITRGVVLKIKALDYVQAARAAGVHESRVLWRHVLPNCLPPLIVQSTLLFATAILSAAYLGFLGLGAQPPTPEWGTMLSKARDFLRVAPHVSIFPGVTIMVTVLGLNLLGDGLRDVLDPRTSQT